MQIPLFSVGFRISLGHNSKIAIMDFRVLESMTLKTKAKKKLTDALDIVNRRYYKGALRRAEVEEARVNAEAARLIYQLRSDAKLSQSELAKLVGTTQSVVSRLEDDDYDGHSLTMLARIAAALGKRLVLTTKSTQEVA